MLPLAAIGLASSAIGGIYGAFQAAKAKRDERNLVRPFESVNALLAQNQAQAQNMAQVGMAQQQYNNTLNQQNSNLATVLNQQSRTGRNTPIAGLLRQSNLATQGLNAQDANMRQQNQRLAMQQNQTLAQEQMRVNKWNVQDPYLRAAQNIAARKDAGTQNMFGALGNIAQIGMSSNVATSTGDGGNGTKAERGAITNFLPNAAVGNDLAPLKYNNIGINFGMQRGANRLGGYQITDQYGSTNSLFPQQKPFQLNSNLRGNSSIYK